MINRYIFQKIEQAQSIATRPALPTTPNNPKKLEGQESTGKMSLSRQRFSERALRSTTKLDLEIRKRLVNMKQIGQRSIKTADQMEEPSSQKEFSPREVTFKYSIRFKVGQGTFGTVWNGSDANGTLELAIKRMRITDDDLFIRQLETELYANEQLQHENIGEWI